MRAALHKDLAVADTKLQAARAWFYQCIDAAWADLPLYQGLSRDHESLHDLAARARVIVTTVGPYTSRGEALVAACVAEGCDYVDLTGEPSFWKGVIERHHDATRWRGHSTS